MDYIKVCVYQSLSTPHLFPPRHTALEWGSVKLHRIQADVDENLSPVNGAQAKGVQSFIDHLNCTVYRTRYVSVIWEDDKAGTHCSLGKQGIRTSVKLEESSVGRRGNLGIVVTSILETKSIYQISNIRHRLLP